MIIKCNEKNVTGMNIYTHKGVVEENSLRSNVLFSKSFVVEGYGKAVVCAVGKRSQAGMPVQDDIIKSTTMQEEETPLRGLLESYVEMIHFYSYIVMLFIMISFLTHRFIYESWK